MTLAKSQIRIGNAPGSGCGSCARTEAARALGRVDDEQSVEPLLDALEDDSYTVMTSAEHALANMPGLSLPRLLSVAGAPDSLRLRPALRSLAEILDEGLRDEIEALADASQEERRARLEELTRR